MIATTHPVSAEEVMALADGELSSSDAKAVSAHIAQCPECAYLAAQLAATSTAFARWTIPAAPAGIDESVATHIANAEKGNPPSPSTRTAFFAPRHWSAVQLSGLAAVVLLVAIGLGMIYRSRVYEARVARKALVSEAGDGIGAVASQPMPAPPPPPESIAGGGMMNDRFAAPASPIVGSGLVAPAVRARNPEAPEAKSNAVAAQLAPVSAFTSIPMIAHSVSLLVQVRDLGAARTALETLLAHHHGYAAQLTVNTAEDSPRSLQSSLRVPDAELAASASELRALGRVETETQSGEEVTQQHADLVARLTNAREAEQRLRELLAQHTGKIEDVLQVEEEISRVRGEIEQMETDQQVLEHRVGFATIDLQLTEQYREHLGAQSASVPMQIRNAFVAGLRHGADTLLGLLLFVEESAPTVLIWLAILALPGLLLWRRYRRIRTRF